MGHVTYMKEMRNAYNILVDTLEGRNHFGDVRVDTRIILKYILKT
jgi:hypothetical protein